jgi:hypothetical protein
MHEFNRCSGGCVSRKLQPRSASGRLRFALNPAKRVSSENNRERKENNCDRHKRRASEISRQDQEDRDDSEDCCDVVLHNFLSRGLPTLIENKNYFREVS